MTEFKAKILIVEDDESLYNMYKTKFEKSGYEVLVATNWLDASTKLKWFLPDVILLDIMMPDMDWFETLKVIKQQTNIDTKIIMLSNLDKKEDIERAMELWAQDYLIKANVTPKEVLERVESLLSITKTTPEDSSKTTLKIKCPHCGEYINLDLDLIK